jgi:nucleoside-diphosphate-sugar epimerase
MILVTGATGNVGRHVLDLLVAGGHTACCGDRLRARTAWPPATWPTRRRWTRP